jgi:FkbM family methyltransferase
MKRNNQICILLICILQLNSIYTLPITKQTIKTYLPENPIILEAGAHNGSDTEEMARLWPKCTIYAFEPIPKFFDMISQKAHSNDQIKCFKLALSDKNGQAMFYVSSGMSDASSSLLLPKQHLDVCPTVLFETAIKVQTMTLDSWAEQNNVDHIDFMWLDMQGGEYQMLKSSKKILPTVKVIFTEVSLCELYQDCPNYPEFKAWMELQGFKAVEEDFGPKYWGDALFVRCRPAPSESI